MNRKTALRLSQVFILWIVIGMMLVPANVWAASKKTKKKTIKAGQTYYVLNKNIKKNKVTSNTFEVTPKDKTARYDLVYAFINANGETRTLAITDAAVSLKSTSKAYMKKTAKANSGALLGIRVRTGEVTLKVTSTRKSGKFALTFKKYDKKRTPLVSQKVKKNKTVEFTMATGNVTAIPVIFGGLEGTVVRRATSETRYEQYTFRAKNLLLETYENDKRVAKTTVKYHSTYELKDKTYYSVLFSMPVSAKAKTKSSGVLTVVTGTANFMYPREYLGITCTVE